MFSHELCCRILVPFTSSSTYSDQSKQCEKEVKQLKNATIDFCLWSRPNIVHDRCESTLSCREKQYEDVTRGSWKLWSEFLLTKIKKNLNSTYCLFPIDKGTDVITLSAFKNQKASWGNLLLPFDIKLSYVQNSQDLAGFPSYLLSTITEF